MRITVSVRDPCPGVTEDLSANVRHVPSLESLRDWLKKNVKRPCDGLTRWVAACREQLESLTASEPREPADFRREAPITCKCSECAELKRFLQDPANRCIDSGPRRTGRASREYDRQFQAGPEDHDRSKGSPHTLVCTKTTASYLASLKEYHTNQERLSMTRSIEAALP